MALVALTTALLTAAVSIASTALAAVSVVAALIEVSVHLTVMVDPLVAAGNKISKSKSYPRADQIRPFCLRSAGLLAGAGNYATTKMGF